MSLAHTVTDQEDDITSDGTIFNCGEPRAGHDCLSGEMCAGARNWPRRRNGGASIGTIILPESVSAELIVMSSLNPCVARTIDDRTLVLNLSQLTSYRSYIRLN
jgi:hypothetical protein